ncbi:hypothetical protein HDU81_006317 [Chytriomyces hyalinus]|nr:hypothetical protein HDU81_006317 [Chytriomyces hyalinus]
MERKASTPAPPSTEKDAELDGKVVAEMEGISLRLSYSTLSEDSDSPETSRKEQDARSKANQAKSRVSSAALPVVHPSFQRNPIRATRLNKPQFPVAAVGEIYQQKQTTASKRHPPSRPQKKKPITQKKHAAIPVNLGVSPARTDVSNAELRSAHRQPSLIQSLLNSTAAHHQLSQFVHTPSTIASTPGLVVNTADKMLISSPLTCNSTANSIIPTIQPSPTLHAVKKRQHQFKTSLVASKILTKRVVPKITRTASAPSVMFGIADHEQLETTPEKRRMASMLVESTCVYTAPSLFTSHDLHAAHATPGTAQILRDVSFGGVECLYKPDEVNPFLV